MWTPNLSTNLFCGLLVATNAVNAAIHLDLTQPESIKEAAKTIAYGMVKYYNGNETGMTPGILAPPPAYYWWEGGAMWGSLIDYWYYTGDEQYNEIVTQGIQWQVGGNQDFMPLNQTQDMGNDDQAFWAMTAMSAAELGFPNPPEGQPSWLALAQAVFNDQAGRWDTATCGGGLHWQVYSFNKGYYYKNTIASGCFFNLATRLGRYTGNQTYFDWAEKAWDWVSAIGLVDDQYHFFDGTDSSINCTQIDHLQWTYNAGVFLLGAANIWNVTQDQKWHDRIVGIMGGASVFFTGHQPNVMAEVACEFNTIPTQFCDVDQQSFKAYLSRWMAATTKLAPFTTGWAMPLLQASAMAAVGTCTGGTDGNQCGLKWNTAGNDGQFMGVGEQMAALEVVLANLIEAAPDQYTANDGGSSKGNPGAGTGGKNHIVTYNPITTADRAGAGILTTIILVGLFSGATWMVASG